MRLIDADELMRIAESVEKNAETIPNNEAQISGMAHITQLIYEAPTIDAEPVKHGEWEEKETYLNEGDCEITEWQSARCSVCGKYHTTPYMYYFDKYNFCPNCGAKMDK